LIEFFESLVGTFRITQPGSSVATSLVPGEAVQKKIGILDIKDKQYRLYPIPLTQVRTFVMTEISLREHRSNLDPSDPKIDEKLNKLLEEEVQLMIMGAKDKAKEQLSAARAAGNDAADASNSTLKYKLQKPEEVLVRLRVDHAGYATINNQRFGAKFLGQVANPTDILLFHRKKDPKLASVVKKQGLKPMAPAELERANMEDLVRDQLVASADGKLNIYGEQDLAEALEEFVEKSGMLATIADLAADKLGVTQKHLIKGKQGDVAIRNDSQILEVLERDKASNDTRDKSQVPQPSGKRTNTAIANNVGDDNNDTLHDDTEIVGTATRKRKAAKVTAPRNRAPPVDDSTDEDMAQPTKTVSKPQQTASTRPQRAGTKNKVAYTLDDSDDDEYISEAIVDSDDMNDEIEEEEEVVPTRSTKNKKAPAQRGRKAVKTTTKAAASSSKRSRAMDYDDSDDEIENNRTSFDSADIDTDWGTAKTRTQRSQW
jgi:double-strand break repair protein MRE11